jgi:hypothetical protein
MKMKAPENMGGFTYQGTSIEIPGNRIVIALDTAMASTMESHGFTRVDDSAPAPSQQVDDDSTRERTAPGNAASVSTAPGGNSLKKKI